MEEKGLAVDLSKTVVTKSDARFGSTESSGKWPCREALVQIV